MHVKVFGLGGIDLLRCCCSRAITETCYCQYIHRYIGHTPALHHNIHDITPQQIYTGGAGEGFLKRAAAATASISQLFECWAASSLLLMWKENNWLWHVNNDVIILEWVRTRPVPSRVLWQNLVFLLYPWTFMRSGWNIISAIESSNSLVLNWIL